jgi:hypothetical protein
VALVVFFVTWSRRSKPTGTHPNPTAMNRHDPNGEA